MHIMTSSAVMDHSGTPTYTLTMVRELEERGHNVTVYCPGGGRLFDAVNAIADCDLDTVESPDVIVAQHNTCAQVLHDQFPGVPFIFSSHGVLPGVDQPPEFEADWYITINEDGRENMITKGVPKDRITLVRDFIDTTHFQPKTLPDTTLRRVLYISNFKKWKTHTVITRACAELGLKLKACGAPYGRCLDIKEDINQADLIISIGRGILEAMSCGRPVVSYDRRRGDGYLTPEVYMESRTRNFAGEKARHRFDRFGLIDELKRYDPEDGQINRQLILDYHDCRQGVDRILEVIGKVNGQS